MSLTERISRGVTASLCANLLTVAANGALTVVFARYLLGPDEYGLLFYALSVLSVVTLFGTLGLPSSVARYVTDYAETDPTKLRYIIRTSLVLLLALSGTVGLVVTLGSPLVASLLSEPELATPLLFAVAFVTLRALWTYLGKVFQGFNRVDYSALVNSVSAVARVVFAVGFVLLGFGVAGALAGFVVGLFVAVALGMSILYAKFYRHLDAAEPDEGLLRRIVEYSVPLTVTRGAGVLDKQVDTILIGVLLTPTAVGFYTLAKQVSDVCVVPAKALGFTVSPAFGEQQAADQDRRAARLYERSLRYVLLLYVPAVVGIVLVADPLVRYVFGTEYLGAVTVLQVMGLFVLVNAVNRITSDGLDYLGRARDRAAVKLATALANLLLNLLLIPLVGVVGAAAATVMTHTAYTTANVYIIGRELPLRFSAAARTLAGVSVVSLLMGAGVYLLLPFVAGLPTLLAVVGFGVLVWALGATVGGLLEPRRIAALFG